MEMLIGAMFVCGFYHFIAGVIYLLVWLPRVKKEKCDTDTDYEKKRKNNISIGSLLLACGIFFMVTSFMLPKIITHNIYDELAKEVQMEQVSVKGKNTFSAQVKIIFNDGELEDVILIPKTTRKEE